MEEKYISYNTAKLASDAGFDELSDRFYGWIQSPVFGEPKHIGLIVNSSQTCNSNIRLIKTF